MEALKMVHSCTLYWFEKWN